MTTAEGAFDQMSADDTPEFLDPPATLKTSIDFRQIELDVEALLQADQVIADLESCFTGWAQDDLKKLNEIAAYLEKNPLEIENKLHEIREISTSIGSQSFDFGFELVGELAKNLQDMVEKYARIGPAFLPIFLLVLDCIRIVLDKKMEGDGGEKGQKVKEAVQMVIGKAFRKEFII